MSNICPLCKSSQSSIYIEGGDFEIIKCNNCTNAWTSPAPPQIEYENMDFHSEIDKSNFDLKKIEDLPIQWQDALKMQIKLIKKYLKKGGNILEIGCGEGLLLNELSKQGFIVHGIEPSLSGSKRAIERGLNVATGYFPHKDFENHKFDLIIMSHVLEHIENPLSILENIKNIANENAYLLLIQSNYNGLIPKLERAKWYAWVPEHHFWHFTPKGLFYLASNLKFSQVHYEYSSLVHSAGSFVKKILLRFISTIGYVLPFTKDQFHILFKIK